MGKRGHRKFKDNYERRENNEEHEFKTTIEVKPQTPGQKRYIQEIIRNEIILCQGPAGTGKTVIAIGMALQEIYSKTPRFDKIILMRPVKEACDEHVGFLPGDLDDKMQPWAAPVVDNLQVFISPRAIRSLFQTKKLEVLPLAFARGRSLNNAFIILDEAQNCSEKQMLMALTRIGNGSKMVINGDIDQNDVSGRITGLEDAMSRLDGLNNVSTVFLDDSDIVRNPIIKDILERYRV